MYGRQARPVAKKRLVSYDLIPLPAESESEGHRFGVNRLLVLNAGADLLSAGRDGVVRCWNVAGGKRECVARYCGHAGWVTDMVAAAQDRLLVTGSNDGTLKLWELGRALDAQQQDQTGAQGPALMQPLSTMAWHEDYVKALAYAPHAAVVASGGLDRRVLLWDLRALAAPLVVLEDEADAATGAPPAGQDAHDAAWQRLCRPAPVTFAPLKGGNAPQLAEASQVREVGRQRRGSIYSVDVDAAGAVAVSGSTDCMIRVFDARVGAKVCKLDGHADNVRAVRLDEGGARVVSGSSDGTVRVWDLRQQCCLGVYEPSPLEEGGLRAIWRLHPCPASADLYYSCGRGGQVYLTDFRTGESAVVCDCGGRGEVLDVAVDMSSSAHWAASRAAAAAAAAAAAPDDTAATAAPMEVDGGGGDDADSGGSDGDAADDQSADTSRLSAGAAAAARSNVALWTAHTRGDVCGWGGGGAGARAAAATAGWEEAALEAQEEPAPPVFEAPLTTIAGRPGVVRHQILANRIHLLTQDDATPPGIALWDLSKAHQVRRYPPGTDFSAALTTLSSGHLRRLAVRPWCAVEVRGGVPAAVLSEGTVFDGDIYASDSVADLDEGGAEDAPVPLQRSRNQPPQASDDIKVNLGARVLRALLVQWRERRLQTEGKYNGDEPDKYSADSHEDSEPEDKAPVSRQVLDDVEVWVTEVEGGCGGMDRVLLQRRVGDFSGREHQGALPAWALDCVWRGEYSVREQPRVQFCLVLDAAARAGGGGGGSEAELAQAVAQAQKLTASALMRIRKVMAYVLQTKELRALLGDSASDHTDSRGDGEGDASDRGGDRGWESRAQDFVQLKCNDEIVAPDMYLGAVAQHVWRDASRPMVFAFRAAA